MSTYSPPINERAQQDANTLLSIQALQADELPPALDCGRNQKRVNALRDMFQLIPAQGRAEALQNEIRNMCDLDMRFAELLGDEIAYKKVHHPKAPDSAYQKPKEDECLCPALPEYAQLPPALAKNVCPPLDWFIKYAERIAYRSYPGFYPIAGIHLFSAVAAGRPVLEMGGNRLSTGLYFANIANTTLDAKSYLERIVVQRCLDALGLSFLLKSGVRNTSPEKFLSNLAGKHVPDNWEDLTSDEQRYKEDSFAFCAQPALYFDEGGEFVDAILQKNSILAKFADLLLQLYSAPPVFDGSDTISRGAEMVYNACITIMMSMTIPDIAKYAYAGSKLWAKGFWGRFDFMVADEVTEEEIHRRMAQAKNVRGYNAPPEMLIASLDAWHKRLGGIPYCEVKEKEEDKTENKKKDKAEGKKTLYIDREPFPQVFYKIDEDAEDAWLAYTEALQVLCLKLPEDLRGNYGRLPETAMRMALIIASLSNTIENCIELKHWAKAQELAEILRENLHKLYAKVATPEESFSKKSQNKILEHLEKNADRWIDSSELQRYCHISGPDIAPILLHLVNNEMVQYDDKAGESKKKKLYRTKAGGAA